MACVYGMKKIRKYNSGKRARDEYSNFVKSHENEIREMRERKTIR